MTIQNLTIEEIASKYNLSIEAVENILDYADLEDENLDKIFNSDYVDDYESLTDFDIYDGYLYDKDNYCIDEYEDCIISVDDSVMAYNYKKYEYITHIDNCTYVKSKSDDFYVLDNDLYDLAIELNGDYYDKEYLWYFDIVYIEDTDDFDFQDNAYYNDDDACWYSEPQQNNDLLFDYHSDEREGFYIDSDHTEGTIKAGIGFEIEKSEMPNFDFDKYDVLDATGCKLEKDSSVDDGFELVTATYNLFSQKTLERLEQIKDFCEVEGVDNAGGHINLSVEGYTSKELLKALKNWLPLIFAMYKGRLKNTYCEGKKFEDLFELNKYQAIKLKNNCVEFRLISAVRNYKTLLFRLDLFKIIVSNLNVEFKDVLAMLIYDNSELSKLLRSDVYENKQKFTRLFNDTVSMYSEFIESNITDTQKSIIQEITNKLN